MADTELKNRGLIRLHKTHSLVAHTAARTLIVSGVARSGTSMVARVLDAAGVPMGDRIDDVVFEDHDFAELFNRPNLDQDALGALVRQRNDAHPVWGFKRPQIHQSGAETISRFRNPLVIVTLRDPVAIAERYAIAEQIDARTTLSMAMGDLQEMVLFAQQLTCPVLLISYEKAVRNPARLVERLLEFCGLQRSATERQRLRRLVEPDRPAYIESARRTFGGYIDGIQGTVLGGWAYERSLGLPLAITVFRDDVPVLDGVADQYRQDLADAGIDDGRHGFSVDLAGCGFVPTSRVTVRVKDRNFALNNSGASAAELGADLPTAPGEPSRLWALTPFG